MPDTAVLTAAQIRQQFLDFFTEKHGHAFVPSSPVVPHDDPTLLFTNAGMNQFKDVFLGQGDRPYTRAANTQKCIRAGGKHNDLEDVGKDTYHHTFFEMLGNWSFGDYFKREAIQWAWELLTEVWGLEKDRLYVTVFAGDDADDLDADDEAAKLWTELTDVDPEHVSRWAKKDNFWEMGDVGPCGPCSEIHYDSRPEEERSREPGSLLVNRDHPAVIEIWNLVFIQYNRAPGKGGQPGKLTPLPARHVDTGMGFERITRVLQGKNSNYDTDIWSPIFRATHEKTGTRPYQGSLDDPIDIAYRVIADHIRCLTIAITDGATPGNEGRAYVLRRILRRAVRHARQTMGTDKPVLCELVPAVVESLGDAFPELKKNPRRVAEVIRQEELAFLKTIDRGIDLFEEAAERTGTPALRAGSQSRYEVELLRALGDEINLEFATEINARDFVARDPYPKGEPVPDDLHVEKRNLPHVRLNDATYFATWRILPDIEDLSADERSIALNALTHWDNERCRVFGAVVMPDHVHWLVKPFENHSLDDLLESVKRFAARQINEHRGTKGSIWSPESFDHVVRDIRWLSKFLHYICWNPVKASLAEKPSAYPWLFVHSSVRTVDNRSPIDEITTPGSEGRGTCGQIPAEDAFKLHDTYGFPIDLTCVMAEERGMTVDVEGFEKLMEEAREKSRAGTEKEESFTLTPQALDHLRKVNIEPTEDHHKYAARPVTARVEAIWNGNDFDNLAAINRRVAIILDRTCLYAESGGQVGDRGELLMQYAGEREPATFDVEDTQSVAGYVLHIGRITEGELHVADTLEVHTERNHRDPVEANHTATHLLNFALREVVGDEVDQKGSLVAPDRLRFDFSCAKALTPAQIERVEQIVNERIEQDLAVHTDTVPLELAKKIHGVRAVFGEKYPDPVRVVAVGAPIDEIVKDAANTKWRDYSIEFCGGTHLDSTATAKHFVITKEEALAAGVRRVTALTGTAAQAADMAGRELLERVQQATSLDGTDLLREFDEIGDVSEQLTTGVLLRQKIHGALDELREKVKAVRKESEAGAREKVVEQARQIAAQSAGHSIIVEQIDDADKDTLLAAMDVIRGKCPDAAVMLFAPDHEAGKVAIAATVPPEKIEQGLKAGDWVREAATACGGGGGGRPDMAQAGGKDPGQTGFAMRKAKDFAEGALPR